jgi:glycerol kinase
MHNTLCYKNPNCGVAGDQQAALLSSCRAEWLKTPTEQVVFMLMTTEDKPVYSNNNFGSSLEN